MSGWSGDNTVCDPIEHQVHQAIKGTLLLMEFIHWKARKRKRQLERFDYNWKILKIDKYFVA